MHMSYIVYAEDYIAYYAYGPKYFQSLHLFDCQVRVVRQGEKGQACIYKCVEFGKGQGYSE